MKILKNKTYQELINEVECLRRKNESRILEILRQEELNYNSKFNFSIRRIISGKICSGKTTLIKSLIRNIKSFYVIDLTGEYAYLSEEDRFSPDIKNIDIEINNILEKIKQNSKKVIIIDGIELIDKLNLGMTRNIFLNILFMEPRVDFLISTYSYSKLKVERYIDYIDCVYLLGEEEIHAGIPPEKIIYYKQK